MLKKVPLLKIKSLLSSREIYKCVKRGDYILKKKKNGKGSRAWEQFRII